MPRIPDCSLVLPGVDIRNSLVIPEEKQALVISLIATLDWFGQGGQGWTGWAVKVKTRAAIDLVKVVKVFFYKRKI